MKPGVPWSVKGIEPQARETAKEAAHSAGLTLGQWLNQKILEDQSKAERSPKKRRSSSRKNASSTSNGVNARLEELSRKLDRLASPAEPEPFEAAPYVPVENLVDHIKYSERKTDTAIQALRQDLTHIAGRLENRPEPDLSGFAAFESTLAEMVNHIELTDRRNSDVLRTIQTRLSELSTRVSDQGNGNDHEAFEAIERRLGEFANRIENQSSVQDSVAFKSLQSQIESLDGKIRDTHSRSKNDPVVTSLETRYSQLADKLSVTERLLPARSEIDSLSTQIGDIQADISGLKKPIFPSAIKALESRLSTLGGEIEALRNNTVNPGRIDKFSSHLEELQQRLRRAEQGLGNSPDIKSVEARFSEIQQRIRATEESLRKVPDTSDLNTRLSEITKRLDHSANETKVDPQIELLETRVNEISSRLDRGDDDGKSSALRDLEAQINGIGARLDEAEERFDTPLQSIQANLSQLYESLETSNSNAVKTAEQAAIAAAQKLIAQQSGTNADEAIAGLERQMAEVKNQSGIADRRTQETLEAVHDTLKGVIDRMAALEKTGARPAEAVGASASTSASAAAPKVAAPSNPKAEDQSDFRLPPLPTAPSLEPSSSSPEAASGDPVSPQLGAPFFSEDEDTPQGGNFSRTYGEPEEKSGRNSDFIAAARRAAQAAANESNDAPDQLRIEGDPAEAAPTSKNKKRTLLYTVAVLFIAVGALSVSGIFKFGSEDGMNSPTNTGSIPQQAPAAPNSITTETPPTAKSYKYVPDLSGTGSAPLIDLANNSASNNKAAAFAIENVAPAKTTPPFGNTSAMVAPNHALSPSNGFGSGAEISLAPSKPGRVDATRTVSRVEVAPRTQSKPLAPRAASLTPPPSDIGPDRLRNDAANGNPAAQFEVGARYAQRSTNGKNKAESDAKAVVWYQRAAAQGHPPAQYRLGTLFEKGRGVKKDINLARSWYERAAQSGNRKAMHNLAVLLANNTEGQPDFGRAARWFSKAADLGLADSQFNLGILHERGLGVEENPAQAYKWFHIAANAGDKDAAARVKAMENAMAPADLAKARAQIAAWNPKTQNPAANFQPSANGKWGQKKSQSSGRSADQALVAQTQALLTELGYNPGPVDGLPGAQTRNAIETFERERGMPVTGRAGVTLVKALEEAAG